MLAARMNDGRFGPPPTCTRLPLRASGGRRRRTSRTTPRRGSGTCGRSSSRTRDAPHRRAKPAHQRRLREGLQRGQRGRLTHEHDPNAGPDRCCDLLAGSHALWNRVFRTLAASQDSTSSRAPACSRWRTWPRRTRSSAVGTTSTTGSSGGRSRRSAKPTPTAIRQPRPTRTGAAVRPGDAGLHRPRS